MKAKAGEEGLFSSQTSLQRAALTLRAIQQRYETGHNAHRFPRGYCVTVAIDGGDMAWISAAIIAVEEAIVSREEAIVSRNASKAA